MHTLFTQPHARRQILTLLFALCPVFVCAHTAGAEPASMVTQTISLGRGEKTTITLSPEALKAYPVQSPPDIAVKNRKGETQRVLKGYNGVKLIDLLDKAALVSADPNDFKKTIVVATASDGYKAVFSWNELYNTSVGAGVLVLYAKDGKPLADDEGRIALISINDIGTGPRHVRWLKDIQVRTID